jgi:hypothetical protein
MPRKPSIIHFSRVVLFLCASALLMGAQTQPAQSQQSDDVPVTDAESGPCSIELTVTDSNAKPVFAARIDYHAAYGFMGTHKLDMAVYTNAQGKARFTGIPAKVKKPPIEFKAKKDDLIGLATMDPASECQAKHDIVLTKSKPPTQ